MATNRPGDVLAGRYRLEVLLSESGQGRFWRAYDTVLARAVAIHVIDAADERADRLMEAARASARIVEPRLLRVLDAANDGSICYVVNEWGTGTSLDHLVAAEGPLPPRRAAWIVAEVAAALANAHDHGVAHGRLNPENVLIDTTGSVRLIGFAVEAALYGLGPDRTGIDVVDLAGLLHVALTGRWAGLSESAVPRAPREHHGLHYRVLRPRQVRAGVPRVLDDLVDEVLNRPHGRHAGPHTAREIHQTLADFVGDPAGLPDELARRPDATAVGMRPVTTAPAAPAQQPPAQDPPAQEPPAQEPPAPQRPEPEPTVAGLPVFEDSGTDDAPAGSDAWFAPRADPPAPPPPLDPVPAPPLFAPAPADGSPVRRPRPGRRQAPQPAPPVAEPADAPYWPFETGTDARAVPGRRWLRLGVALVVFVLLVVAAVIAYDLGRGEDAAPGGGTTRTPSAGATSAPPHRIGNVTALDFDPYGDPPEENRDLVGRAVDGDPATSWRTSTYEQDLGPGGLKTGVGLVLDLRRRYRVTEVDLTFEQAGTGVSVYVSDTPPQAAGDLADPVASLDAGAEAKVALVAPATGRYVTLWFTSLPRVTGGFRTELAEAVVVGTAA